MYVKFLIKKIKESQHGCGSGSCGGYGHSFCEFTDAEYDFEYKECSVSRLDTYGDEICIYIPQKEIIEALKESESDFE